MTTEQAKPSFDCTKARSIPEKLICSDKELADADNDLNKIFLKAREVTKDKKTFNKINKKEWVWREKNCVDKTCIINWINKRKTQLNETIDYNNRITHINKQQSNELD